MRNRSPRESSSEDDSVNKAVKVLRRKIVNDLAVELYNQRIDISNTSNYDITERFYKEKLGVYIWLKKEDLRNALRRLSKKYKEKSNDVLNGTIVLNNNDDNQGEVPSNILTNDNNSVIMSSISGTFSSSRDSLDKKTSSNSELSKKTGRLKESYYTS